MTSGNLTKQYLNENTASGNIESIAFGVIGALLIFLFRKVTTYVIGGKLDKELTEKLKEVTKDENVTVYRITDSAPNAFNAGYRKLYYTSGITKFINKKELIAVLLHEYGHFKYKHTKNTLRYFGIIDTVLLTLLSKFGGNLNTFVKFIIFIFGEEVAGTIHTILTSKKQEYVADKHVKDSGYKKELISALKKLEKWTKKELCGRISAKECKALMSEQFGAGSTHPSFKDRIERLGVSLLKKIQKVGPRGIMSINRKDLHMEDFEK